MTTTVYTDRSRIETYQRCPRARWLEYHEAGTGLSPAKKPLALCVGGSVHRGLEVLLRESQAALWDGKRLEDIGQWRPFIEDAAVDAALADFRTHRSALALDTTEAAALATPDPDALATQLAATALDLGMAPTDPSLAALHDQQAAAAGAFDDWLWEEQAALVEGMVRAYARRRLVPLLAEFEVLEVEREGEWTLASRGYRCECGEEFDREDVPHLQKEPKPKYEDAWALVFMSRPDALLRSRADNSLYLLSYKTAAAWDVRKARDAEHDMQGLSEGVEVEKRLAEWWDVIHHKKGGHPFEGTALGITAAMGEYLRALPAPPRILGIRYEYLLKGSRYADRDLSARFGVNVWAQRSHLVRAYSGDAGWCWSYDFLKDDGSASKLYYKTWRPRAVWESMPIRDWIDLLDSATEAMSAYDSTVGMEPRPLGYRSDAQAQGYTREHPLDAVFPAPLTVYRSDDQLRDWIEQVEASEVRVAEAVAQVAAAPDDGERRHLLNVLMPQSRRACSYPSECVFTRLCYGGDDIRRAPLDSGYYKPRIANHAAERDATTEASHD